MVLDKVEQIRAHLGHVKDRALLDVLAAVDEDKRQIVQLERAHLDQLGDAVGRADGEAHNRALEVRHLFLHFQVLCKQLGDLGQRVKLAQMSKIKRNTQ